MKFSVSETNFPAEAISADGVRFLFRVLDEIDAAQAEPLPSIDDSITAFQTILARQPQISAARLNEVLGYAKELGFKTDNLEYPEH